MSIFFAFLILLDFKILPKSSINVALITRYIDMDSEKLALKFKDNNGNKFQFGISFEDIKKINIASIKNYTCQKSMLFRQKTHMVLNIDKNDVIIFNHYCVYKIFYFYFILLLPLNNNLFKRSKYSLYSIFLCYFISFRTWNGFFNSNPCNMRKFYFSFIFFLILGCHSEAPKELFKATKKNDNNFSLIKNPPKKIK